MPIYQYVCSACGGEHEALQKISDAPLTDCPACGKATLRKQLTAAAFRLKGTGWYETDFKNPQKKPEEKKGEAKKDGDKKEPKADNKSDKKSSSSDSGAGKKAANGD